MTRREASDCNGVESYVLDCILEDKCDWFPRKTCVALENAGEVVEEVEDPNAIVLSKIAQLDVKLKKMEDITALSTRMSKIEEAIGALSHQ